MKRTILVIGGTVLITVSALLACNSSQQPVAHANEGIEYGPKVASLSSDELVARGRYLVTIMGCNDCHSPKVMTPQGPAPDSAHLLSGHPAKMPLAAIDPKATKDWILFNQSLTAFAGPWGVSFAANITSDASGIGNWTEEQFFRAMREGKYKGMEGGRPMLPPMPWQQFKHATDEDLRAIFSYLKATPAVDNVVPAPLPPKS
ncbi:MAG: diheme cytochrome c-553 [Chitinophagaceae bacterium]|nr:MAG: diheme cytochrome c-553 [Chitinophagaceae bacterium]